MLESKDEVSQMMLLLQILKLLSATNNYRLLASPDYENVLKHKDSSRIDQVVKYVFDHFTEEISLDTVSQMIGMNKQAFCRYFKKLTQKTFTEFVNEIRIGNACKLLHEKELTVGQLAYNCGFNSISNFNKFFKLHKGVTPKAYQKEIFGSN